MKEELKKILSNKPSIDDVFKFQLNITELEKKEKEMLERRTSDFASRINEKVKPHHSAKEMVENIVKSALEAEYGASFIVSKGFESMVSKLADVIITNPELRRQALSIASDHIENKGLKYDDQKKN